MIPKHTLSVYAKMVAALIRFPTPWIITAIHTFYTHPTFPLLRHHLELEEV
jgi:hypothetical protein